MKTKKKTKKNNLSTKVLKRLAYEELFLNKFKEIYEKRIKKLNKKEKEKLNKLINNKKRNSKKIRAGDRSGRGAGDRAAADVKAEYVRDFFHGIEKEEKNKGKKGKGKKLGVVAVGALTLWALWPESNKPPPDITDPGNIAREDVTSTEVNECDGSVNRPICTLLKNENECDKLACISEDDTFGDNFCSPMTNTSLPKCNATTFSTKPVSRDAYGDYKPDDNYENVNFGCCNED